jgi:hypothetical protein
VNLVLARREMILFRKKVIGEGAVNTSTIKNLHFNFLMFFIFNPMAEVARRINLLETILSLARPFILIRYYFFFLWHGHRRMAVQLIHSKDIWCSPFKRYGPSSATMRLVDQTFSNSNRYIGTDYPLKRYGVVQLKCWKILWLHPNIFNVLVLP